MRSLHKCYIRAFEKFSQEDFDTRNRYKTMTGFALILNVKANELIKRAELNNRIDLTEFRKEISEVGCQFVRKFGDRRREENEMK